MSSLRLEKRWRVWGATLAQSGGMLPTMFVDGMVKPSMNAVRTSAISVES